MNRRDILLLLAAPLLWPLRTFSEESHQLPVVGLLVTHPPLTDQMFDYVHAGMREFGHEDGMDIKIEIRTALGHLERVPDLARELVELHPIAIMVVNEIAIRAVQKATNTIPIVMVGYTVNDPVSMGLIDAYARPGGNVTGLFTVDSVLIAKRLEVLKEAVPGNSRVAVFWDSNFGRHQLDELQRASIPLGLKLHPIDVRSPQDFDAAFKTVKRNRDGALILTFSPLFWVHQARIANIALEEKLPTISEFFQYVQAGGLLSYGTFGPDNWARGAYYVDRLLKGAKVADLPVEQASTFKLMVNLKTAKALGITIPQSILLRADQVIR